VLITLSQHSFFNVEDQVLHPTTDRQFYSYAYCSMSLRSRWKDVMLNCMLLCIFSICFVLIFCTNTVFIFLCHCQTLELHHTVFCHCWVIENKMTISFMRKMERIMLMCAFVLVPVLYCLSVCKPQDSGLDISCHS